MMDGEFAATPQFMCDVDGHPEQPALRLALEELQFFFLRRCGCWGFIRWRSSDFGREEVCRRRSCFR